MQYMHVPAVYARIVNLADQEQTPAVMTTGLGTEGDL